MNKVRPQVLVVDDQLDVAQTLTAPLANAGMDLYFARDGEEALILVQAGNYDLLIVDMKMPPGEWGGLWLLENLKSVGTGTRAIVMSGEGSMQQVKAALRLGAADWIDKGDAHQELVGRCLDVIAAADSNLASLFKGDDISQLLGKSESQELERKSSFLVPIDSKNPNTRMADIQRGVGKSIAALANTDGGHVIIGQADNGEVLGLSRDFAQCKNGDRDGFAQRLVQYCDNELSPKWEVLGLRLNWLTIEGLDVAIIEVPKSREFVALGKGNNLRIYVRRETRTDALEGLDLAKWSIKRQSA